MNCCNNKNISCKYYENICINCGIIHGYQYINEISFKDMNMSNILFYIKSIYEEKNIYITCVCILKKLITM